MEPVTYLLGAGASFHAMPLLQTMNIHLEVFRDFIFHRMRGKHVAEEPTLKYLASLDDLIKNVNESTTLDQYAKSLYLERSNESAKEKLRDLKVLLTGYLLFEQSDKGVERLLTKEQHSIKISDFVEYPKEIQRLLRTQFDPRYRSFFNYMLNEKAELPDHINILSWNYDLQIEGTYSRDKYTGLDLAQKRLNIYPSPHFDFNRLNRSKIIKINGTAGINRSENTQAGFENYITGLNENIDSLINLIINLYHNARKLSIGSPTLTFSFEQGSESETARNLAKQVINNSRIIVVIGYSFARLNHEVDFELFKDCHAAKKIIFQLPQSDFNKVLNNFKRVNDRLAQYVELYEDLGEFYIH